MTDDDFERAAISWLTARGFVVSKGTDAAPAVSDFAEWYALYPRKAGKSEGEVAYKKALLRGVTHSALCIAVREQLAIGGSLNKPTDERRYLPYPATWLNEDRYAEAFNGRAAPSWKKPTVGGKTERKRNLDAWLENTDGQA